MIITAKPRIPFLWQFTAALSWSAILIQYYLIGAVFIFSLKKFIDNPAGVTFIISLPSIISLIVTPFCSFMSDRIWTRFGRRKPFLITSWAGNLSCIALLPLAPNIWTLIGIFLLFNFFNDIGTGSNETLKQEIVPPKQRGTAAALGKWMTNITQMIFSLVAVGRFDDYQFYAGFPVNGEQSLYWGVSAALMMILLLVAYGVKETESPSKVRGERFTFKGFFGAILNNNLWPVYILITGYAIGKAGLGPLGALLYTEQWSFTKQEMGINMAVGGVINIFLIMILGYFADRLPRLRTYKILILLSIAVEVLFYLYVELVLFDGTPTLVELIVFGEMGAVIGILMGMIYFPLVYDYVKRNELGTYAAGSQIVDKIVHITTLNGVGIFITVWTTWFMPPGGELSRIFTQNVMHEDEVREVLLNSDSGLDPEEITVEAWYGNNARLDEGRAFEVRIKNADSVELDEQRKELESVSNTERADLNNATFLRDNATSAKEIAEQEAIIAEKEATMADLKSQIETIEAELESRASAFHAQVESALSGYLLGEQEEIQKAQIIDVALYHVPLSSRPENDDFGRTLAALRPLLPEMIDLVLVNEGLDFFMELSFPKSYTFDEASLLESIDEAARSRIGKTLPESLKLILLEEAAQAIQLDLTVVEDPINRHISPITSVVYACMAPFRDNPTPERRIWASARALRDYRLSPHTQVTNISEETDYAIRVTALQYMGPDASVLTTGTYNDAVAARLSSLLGLDMDSQLVQRAADLYERTINATAANKLTVARQELQVSFAEPKFNYMSGYIWMIFMSVIGYIITLYFTRREEKGLIRKRGREESEAEAKAEEENQQEVAQGSEDKTRYYTPGYIPVKIGIVLLGCVFFLLGAYLLSPKISLFLSGESTQAVATRVAKEKIGGDRIWLENDADILEAKESYDRSYVFWNEYAFTLHDGTMQTFIATAGKQLEPLHMIRDEDGLPVVAKVWYNPEAPEKVVLPFVWSTWFLPGLLLIFGTIGISIGGCLLYFARKPIAMPILIDEKQEDSEKE